MNTHIIVVLINYHRISHSVSFVWCLLALPQVSTQFQFKPKHKRDGRYFFFFANFSLFPLLYINRIIFSLFVAMVDALGAFAVIGLTTSRRHGNER